MLFHETLFPCETAQLIGPDQKDNKNVSLRNSVSWNVIFVS